MGTPVWEVVRGRGVFGMIDELPRNADDRFGSIKKAKEKDKL